MRRLVVKLTTDAPESVAAALTVTSTAAALGAEVTLWLSGPATWLAVPGREPDTGIDHAPAASDVLPGLPVRVCSQCAARRQLSTADLSPWARIAGAAEFVEACLDPATQALVY